MPKNLPLASLRLGQFVIGVLLTPLLRRCEYAGCSIKFASWYSGIWDEIGTVIRAHLASFVCFSLLWIPFWPQAAIPARPLGHGLTSRSRPATSGSEAPLARWNTPGLPSSSRSLFFPSFGSVAKLGQLPKAAVVSLIGPNYSGPAPTLAQPGPSREKPFVADDLLHFLLCPRFTQRITSKPSLTDLGIKVDRANLANGGSLHQSLAYAFPDLL